jgi:hypothetical protein
LLIAIEVIKRLSTNDVMQGIFQYKNVEPFPAILGLVTLTASIYIAVEGAKILPELLVYDAIQVQPKQESPDAIHADYDERKAEIVLERDRYRKERTYQGKLRHEDTEILNQHNEHIKAIQIQKDSALAELKEENKLARTKAFKVFEERSEQVKVERVDLGRQLVIAAIGFELLFVISMCFSWWYYTECEKERQELKKVKDTAETPTNAGSTAKVKTDTSAVDEDVLVYEEVGARAKKMSFKDYEEIVPEAPPEIEKIKKDYTRICPECTTPFLHNSHNHTYCKRSCMIAARDRKKAKKEV